MTPWATSLGKVNHSSFVRTLQGKLGGTSTRQLVMIGARDGDIRVVGEMKTYQYLLQP
jgi:hypothetical protein